MAPAIDEAAPVFDPAVREFLNRPLHAVLATHAPSGSGLSQSVVWFHLDGETVWLSCHPRSVKVRHVAVDPNVSLLILSPHGGAYVRIEARASIGEVVTDELRHELVRPYRGAETEYWISENPMLVPHTLMRLHPLRVVARGLS
jgi:PPOX class probable F420-dependent enzyme